MTTLVNSLPASQGTRFVTTPADPEAVQTNSVGGPGGQSFTFVDLSGISKLTVVPFTDAGTKTTYITQIVVVNSDGTVSKTFGTTPSGSGTPQVLDLSNDALKTCQLYYSPSHGGRVAGLGIQTVNGKSFAAGDVSGTPTDLTINGNSNVEYYYVAGVFGTSGTNIDILGFYVVEDAIVRRVMQDFTYDLTGTPPTPTPVTLNSLVVENKSSEQQTSLIGFSEQVSSTSEWGNAAGVTLGVETEIKTGIPFLAEGKVKVSAQASYEYSWGGSLTTSQQFNYQASVEVAPGKSVSAAVVVLQAPLSITFKATYLVERVHSGISSTQINGSYAGVSTYDVSVDYADLS